MTKDISKPAVIVFLNEMYDKEKRLRAAWISKNRDKFDMATTLQRKATDYYEKDVIEHNMMGGLATITRDHINAGSNRRKVPIRDAASIPSIKNLRLGHSIIDVGLGDAKEDPRLARPETDLSRDPVMRPVDPKVTKILYKPRPPFGREMYLEKRAKQWPEKKYYFPECSYWDYGWRIADSGPQQRSQYGRRWLMTRNLRNRVGPQPDPAHYNSADIPGNTKCMSL